MPSLVAVQMTSTSVPQDNLATIARILERNRQQLVPNQTLVVLPECAPIFGCSGQRMREHAELIDVGPIQRQLAYFAKTFEIYLIAGSMPIIPNPSSDKYYATSILFSPDGKRVQHYNKIHLFDVEVADKTRSYRESKHTLHGKDVVTAKLPWAELGMTICYDLRFSGLYRALQPAHVICVPSAFTKVTGSAHWHALLQARAIENQCYIVAANQVGCHDDGRETFGHSCIYSPWGERLSCIQTGEGMAVSTFDLAYLESIRQKMPVFNHSLGTYE